MTQMFLLPHDLLQQTQETSIDSTADKSPNAGTTEQPEPQQVDTVDVAVNGKSIDTGHWGKRLHEPSPFLSHDLWSKLGEDKKVP